MTEQNYQRTVEELSDLASMFWPSELSQREAELSIIPKLVETQDQFISILGVEYPNIDNFFSAINLSSIPKNLFLKHLVVLADVGGEQLMRINSRFNQLFPSRELTFIHNGDSQTYRFNELPITGTLNNDKLGISGRKLIETQPFTRFLKDVAMILIFGSACEYEETANILAKCEISSYLGKPDELDRFVRQRYIFVSRITCGARANTLGQIAQNFVKDYLEENLNTQGVDIRHGSIPSVFERGDRPSNFDIIVTDGLKYLAVEVSFQVTTNSTIERKAGQARSRYEQINRAGYKIAYVIDGAGNLLQRTSAVRTICENSHCNVAFSRSELDILCEFIRGYFMNQHTD